MRMIVIISTIATVLTAMTMRVLTREVPSSGSVMRSSSERIRITAAMKTAASAPIAKTRLDIALPRCRRAAERHGDLRPRRLVGSEEFGRGEVELPGKNRVGVGLEPRVVVEHGAVVELAREG